MQVSPKCKSNQNLLAQFTALAGGDAIVDEDGEKERVGRAVWLLGAARLLGREGGGGGDREGDRERARGIEERAVAVSTERRERGRVATWGGGERVKEGFEKE